jgi:hypothetical protein
MGLYSQKTKSEVVENQESFIIIITGFYHLRHHLYLPIWDLALLGWSFGYPR